MSWLWRWFGIGEAPPTTANNRRSSGAGASGSVQGLHSQPSGQAITNSVSKDVHPGKTSSKEIQPIKELNAKGKGPASEVSAIKGVGDASNSSLQTEVGKDGVASTEPERETWGSKLGFMLTLVGYAVGFGNIWRFPALMHENGGVAFLIPYSIMLTFAGIPIFFLELAVGQRLRKGALGSWNEISPYLGGLGLASGLICFMVELYYNTLVAWVLLYFIDSFRSELPWRNCHAINFKKNELRNVTFVDGKNTTAPAECLISNEASKYYWYRRMLDVSESITERGEFNPWMLLVITLAWASVLAILIKGIKSSEKVVYVTALFPYVTLLAFFGANFFQDGWKEGYQILFSADFDKLRDPETWLRAGSQIFFSLGVGYGCLIAFASYLPSNNNCHRDAVVVSLINCGTSLFAAIVLFPVFGSIGKRKFNECLQKRLGNVVIALGLNGSTPIDFYSQSKLEKWFKKYAVKPLINGNITEIYTRNSNAFHSNNNSWTPNQQHEIWEKGLNCSTLETYVRGSGSGTGLVFIGFAEAVTKMPFPPIWSILFFFMLLTLGIDSSFGTLEGAIAVVVDMKLVKLPRWAITSIMVGILYAFSIIFCFGWGMYIQVFLDTFVANWSLLIIGLFETIGISWVYGLAKFSYDVKLMTGSRPNMFILVCWKFITPILILAILIMSIVFQFIHGYKYNVYNKAAGDLSEIKQEGWVIGMGYVILISIIIWVPLQAILVRFGKSLLKKETPAHFPEEELRTERQMGEGEQEEFNRMDQLVMGKSIGDFQASRLSRTSLTENEGRKSPARLSATNVTPANDNETVKQ